MLILEIVPQIKCQQVKSIKDKSLLLKLSKYISIFIKTDKSIHRIITGLCYDSMKECNFTVGGKISFEDLQNEILEVLVVTGTPSQFLNNARC